MNRRSIKSSLSLMRSARDKELEKENPNLGKISEIEERIEELEYTLEEME